jgi:hypothetical protein
MGYSGSFEFEGGAKLHSDKHSSNYGSGNFYSSDKDIAINLSHSVPDASSRASHGASDVVRSIRMLQERDR